MEEREREKKRKRETVRDVIIKKKGLTITKLAEMLKIIMMKNILTFLYKNHRLTRRLPFF